jgi:hypothetical protein
LNGGSLLHYIAHLSFILTLMMTENAKTAAFNSNSLLRFAAPCIAMFEFLNPFADWIETVVGCRPESALIFEVYLPLGDLAAAESFPQLGVSKESSAAVDSLRRFLGDYELPAPGGIRLRLNPYLSRRNGVVWDAIWRETPVAFRFRPLRHAVVWASIPFVNLRGLEGMVTDWRSWLVVHPSDATATLELVREVIAREPRKMSVEGGTDILISDQDYDWSRVVLEPALQTAIKSDFETFWNRRDWFIANRLPYKRGYLLHGAPGNGKTSVVRVMVSHPKVSAFSIDFGSREISNCSLTELFRRAASAAPAVVVFEDLDRYFDGQDENNKNDKVDLPHLLNCLDGLQSQDGVVVVATANDPRRLDPALLRRPGRFDRIAQFPDPVLASRREYFHRMINSWDSETLDCLAHISDGLSFAQLRESYILAGQFAFLRGDEVGIPDLQEAILQVRVQFTGKVGGPSTPEVGFAHA